VAKKREMGRGAEICELFLSLTMHEVYLLRLLRHRGQPEASSTCKA